MKEEKKTIREWMIKLNVRPAIHNDELYDDETLYTIEKFNQKVPYDTQVPLFSDETNKLNKPNFDIEIKAEIKGVAKIEDNISKVKDIAVAMKEYYSNVVFESEEDIKIAVEEKKKVNNFKTEVSTYRKDIMAEFKKPIDVFETTAKETEAILKEVYELIDTPVQNFRDAEKEKIRKDAQLYFSEYALANEVDFVKYDQANINITLGTTKPKIRKEVELFIDNIVKDLELINEEEYKTEILVEYKKSLNASDSILSVKRRIKAIEDEKIRQQEILEKKQQQVEFVEKVEKEVIRDTPIVENKVNENIEKEYKMTFTVCGTMEELKEIKQFLTQGGYKFE